MSNNQSDRLMELMRSAVALMEDVRRERDRRRDAGDDTAVLDRVLRELAPLSGIATDLEVSRAIRGVVERHGTGPWPVEDMAVLAGVPVEVARRVVDQLVAEGIAWRPDDG